MDKEGSLHSVMRTMIIIMGLSMFIFFMWGSSPALRSIVGSVLDPTVGRLLELDLVFGFLAIIFSLTLITSLIQKYTTDQETLKELKKEQKEVQKEMKKYRNHPEKMMELQKSTLPTAGKIMQISMRSSFYTIIPFILFFRWFMDYFQTQGNPLFFGFLNWIWFYIIFTLIFSSVIRKILKIA